LAKLSPAVTGAIDQPWPSIRGLRNVVVHEYFAVDTAAIVDIIDNSLAPLATNLGRYVAR